MAAYPSDPAERLRLQREEEVKKFKFVAKIVGGIVGGIFALSFVFGCYYTVDQGEKAVQTRFGSIVSVTDAGLHLKMPWIDSVTKVSVRTNTIDWRRQEKADHRMEAYSHDQQPAMMSVKVAYHIKGDDKSIRQLYTRFKNDEGVEQAIIIPRAAQAVKTTFGQFTAVSVVQDRAKFNDLAAKAVESLIEQGIEGEAIPVVMDGVQIYDITFSDAYIHAVEQRMQAQVEVEKVTQNLERERKNAEIAVVQANAIAQSNLAKAKAEAEATRIRGEAEASAIKARAGALQSNPYLIQLTIAEKWNGELPKTMPPNGTVPFLDLKGQQAKPEGK